jgi:surfactin synthase thioesterase subunit
MRLREPLPTDLGRLADELACALEPLTGQEFALFGHSMGALLAFELARRLERQGRPLAHLFVAGYGAPHVYRSRTTLHAMSHDAAVAELRRTRAVPDLVLDDEGMSRIFVPIVQSDIGMCVKHGVDVDAEPIAAPLSAFGGALDAEVPAEAVAAWGDLTTAPFRLRILPGDHFFPAGARSELLAAVGTDLAQRRVAA